MPRSAKASRPELHVGSRPAKNGGIGIRFTSAQRPYATPRPVPPLMKTTSIVSTKNCRTIDRRVAPSALRTPISRVRSRTATSITFITPMPPMKSVAMPTAPRKYFMPSVIVRKAFASSTVSQMCAASLSCGSNPWMRPSARRSSPLHASWSATDRGATSSRSTESGSAGGLFGKSWRIALKGTNILLMSRPS